MSILKNLKPETLVTLTALTIASLSPLAVMAGPKIVTAHGAGNGGDRLELTADEGQGDVEIPVPGDMGRDGLFEVVGVPGPGQKDEVEIRRCETDAYGEPVRFGCDYERPKRIGLNQTIMLTPGTYEVFFSDTFIFTKVRPDEKTVETLKKIKVSNTEHSVSFSVFIDFTDRSMQDRYLKSIWADSLHSFVLEYNCNPVQPLDEAACRAWASGNYHQLLNKYVQFNDNGSLYLWQFFSVLTGPEDHGFSLRTRYYVTDPEAGQFVSVFPGVYGIEFTDNETGKTETQFGIHVN